MKKIIKDLQSFSPRQFKGEEKTRKYITSWLEKYNISYNQQNFIVDLPNYLDYSLKVDGKKISCLPCGLKNGKITSKSVLANVLRDGGWNETAIYFNPLCNGISRHTFSFGPALAINYKDVNRILKAKQVEGFLRVKKIKHESANILVGRIKNPQCVVFTHFDSIGAGAIDNASGAAVLLESVTSRRADNILYVFSGCEELSYDKPIYWGHGYRVFERKYKNILEKAKKIILVDGVGNSKTMVLHGNKDLPIIKLGLPIQNLNKWQKKIYFITTDIHKLMSVYHSNSDTIKLIKIKYLNSALKQLTKLTKNTN